MAHPMQHYGKRKPKPAKTELYRIENPQGYQVDTVKHLIYANVLVPVELDYEAAEEAFSERSTDSRSIVDAALGVGEETP